MECCKYPKIVHFTIMQRLREEEIGRRYGATQLWQAKAFNERHSLLAILLCLNRAPFPFPNELIKLLVGFFPLPDAAMARYNQLRFLLAGFRLGAQIVGVWLNVSCLMHMAPLEIQDQPELAIIYAKSVSIYSAPTGLGTQSNLPVRVPSDVSHPLCLARDPKETTRYQDDDEDYSRTLDFVASCIKSNTHRMGHASQPWHSVVSHYGTHIAPFWRVRCHQRARIVTAVQSAKYKRRRIGALDEAS